MFPSVQDELTKKNSRATGIQAIAPGGGRASEGGTHAGGYKSERNCGERMFYPPDNDENCVGVGSQEFAHAHSKRACETGSSWGEPDISPLLLGSPELPAYHIIAGAPSACRYWRNSR